MSSRTIYYDGNGNEIDLKELANYSPILDRKIGELDLTKDEAYVAAEFIDMTLINEIRRAEDIDSMRWLRNIVHAYEKLKKFSGYKGLTEE